MSKYKQITTFKGKILVLSLSIVIFSTVSLSTVFLFNSSNNYISEIAREIRSTINGLTPTLLDYQITQGKQYAMEISRVLDELPHVYCYKIFNNDGIETLSKGCDSAEIKIDLNQERESIKYLKGNFHLLNNINQNSRTFGFAYFVIKTEKIINFILMGLLNMFIVLIITTAASFVLALRFQKSIVQNFENAMRKLDIFAIDENITLHGKDEVELFTEAIHKIREKLIFTQEQLEKSQKLAATGELAGGIAHEINNPVSIISTNSELIEMDLEDTAPLNIPLLLDRVRLIKKTALNIGNIVQALLRLSRNVVQGSMANHNLKNIIGEALILSSPRLSKKKVKLTISPFSEDIFMECNSIQIAQVFANLINNAYDAIQHLNNPEITIQVEHRAHSQIQIKIIDSGPGIALNIQKNIFAQQQTTKVEDQGTGIGLRLVKKIIDAHKGTIQYELINKTSTFILTFPQTQAAGGVKAA